MPNLPFFFCNNKSFLVIIFFFASDSPVFRTVPADVIGDPEDRVSLECQVDSNPEAKYQWMFKDQIKANGPLLNIELSNRTTGTYSCVASVPGFPSVHHSVRVRSRGPPSVLMEQATQFRY